MVSVTPASRYITSALSYHPRYQSRSSMYIRSLLPLNFAELAKAVPIGLCLMNRVLFAWCKLLTIGDKGKYLKGYGTTGNDTSTFVACYDTLYENGEVKNRYRVFLNSGYMLVPSRAIITIGVAPITQVLFRILGHCLATPQLVPISVCFTRGRVIAYHVAIQGPNSLIIY